MASDLTKWADHALSLIRHGEGLLSALYATKQLIDIMEESSNQDLIFRGGLLTLDTTFTFRGTTLPCEAPARPPLERLRVFIDPSIWNLQKQVVKKFPDFGDLGKGLNVFQSLATDIIRELKPYYDLFLAVADFVELATPLVLHAGKFSKFALDHNPDLIHLFYDLLSLITVTVHLFSAECGQTKKLILFAYYRAYQTNNAGAECLDWFRVTNFVSNYDKPWTMLQETFSPVTPRIISTLQVLRPELRVALTLPASSIATSEFWNNEGKTISSNPEADAIPSLGRSRALFRAVMVSSLIAPMEMLNQGPSIDILKAALSYGQVCHSVRNQIFSPQLEMDGICKIVSKASKLKTAFSEGVNASQHSMHVFHKERRDYLRSSLRRIWSLAKAGKYFSFHFSTTITLLSFAQEEIVWYFYHLEQPDRKKPKKDARPLDTSIIELLSLIIEIRGQIFHKQDEITTALVDAIKNDPELPLLLEKLQILRQEQQNSSGNEYDISAMLLEALYTAFEAFPNDNGLALLNAQEAKGVCMNVMRLQVHGSLRPEISNGGAYKEVVRISSRLYNSYFQWFADFRLKVIETTSLKELFFYQTAIHEHIKECFELESDYVKHIGSLGKLCSEFIDNATTFWPTEYTWIMTHTICFATEVFSAAGQYAAANVHEMGKGHMYLGSQLHASEIVNFLPKMGASTLDKKRGGSPKKQVLPEKPLVKPGRESDMGYGEADPNIQHLFKLQNNVRHIIYALRHPTTFSVQEVDFQPFEFFLDASQTTFRNYINQSVYKPEWFVPKDHPGAAGEDLMSFEIKRPSIFLDEIKSYMTAARFVDGLACSDIIGYLRDVLMDLTDLEKMRFYASNQPDALVFSMSKKPLREKGKAATVSFLQSFLVTYTQWYSEFLCSKAHALTTIYAPNKRMFCNIAASTTQAELFTHPKELEALVEIIGLQGVQFLDEKLTRIITMYTASIQEMIQQNIEPLEKIQKNYDDANIVRDTTRKMRSMRDFVQKAITIGYIQAFRKSLYTVVQTSFSRKASDVHALIETIAKQYEPNLQPSEEAKLADIITNHVGFIDKFDGMARWSLSALKDANTAWHLLPVLFASAMVQLLYDENCRYNGAYDAAVNNAHCLNYAFTLLTYHMLPLTKNATSEDVGELHKEFVKVAIMSVYANMKQMSEKEPAPVSTDTIILLLQKFASDSPYVTADFAEKYLSPAIVHSATTNCFWTPENRLQREAGMRSEEELAF